MKSVSLIFGRVGWSTITVLSCLTVNLCGAPSQQQKNDAPVDAAVGADADKPASSNVESPAATTWLRHKIHISGRPANQASLRLQTVGTGSVYLNGQRLVRNHSLQNAPLSWQVGTLLRTGENCLAVSMVTEAPIRISLSIISNGSAKGNGSAEGTIEPIPNHPEWKSAPTVPPAGWQQTDFNDGDWKVVRLPPLTASTELAKAVAEQLEWKPALSARSPSDPFKFRNGDHVVLLGGTFIERAQSSGYLECALLSRAAGQKVTVRNLGWSADTVFAESRGIFDSADKGYLRMIEHVRAEEPTVIVVNYGQNEALSYARSPDGLKAFIDQLAILYDDLKSTGADVILVSPHPFLTAPAPLPDAARWNARLVEFSSAIQQFAASRNARFVDLQINFLKAMQEVQFWLQPDSPPWAQDAEQHPELGQALTALWTDNGMHWTTHGYACVAPILAARLQGSRIEPPQVVVDRESMTVDAKGGEIRDINWAATTTNVLQFQFRPACVTHLPFTLQVRSMMPGDRTISATYTDSSGQATSLTPGTGSDDGKRYFRDGQNTAGELLRKLIVQKDEFYFHRWRPQNITYLLGFRKHEQGNNAVEIAMFDPLIHELEEQIHQARQPQWFTISINITP